MNEQEKSPGKNLKQMEISNLPDKEFKEKVIRILTKIESGIKELMEHFNKELGSIIKNQAELKNIITEVKNILTKEQIGNLEDRPVESTNQNKNKEKEF